MARFGADMIQAAKPILMLWIWGSLLITSFPTMVSAVGESQLKWSEDLVATMKLAQQTGKPVLIHFYGDDCPPCRMLEKRAFKDPQLIESIHSNLLAVRINAQRDTKTAAKFRVNRWPTDVYLYPNGQEIYRNISAQDPSAYEKTVLKVAEKNQKMLAQLRDKRPEAPTMEPLPASKGPVKVSLAGATRVKLSERSVQGVDTADVSIDNDVAVGTGSPRVSQEVEPMVVEAPSPRVALAVENLEPISQESILPIDPVLPSNIAMGGFCPVSLSLAIEASKSGQGAGAAWVKGQSEFAVRHRGRVYHCASQEMQTKFLLQPDAYAPVLSGCDLVEYSKSGKWIDGDCRFGFIDKETGRIFLFSSSLNCQEFAQNCESYSCMVGKHSER
jgi:protein disulfide-isomerase